MADHKRRFESVADAVALQVGARQTGRATTREVWHEGKRVDNESGLAGGGKTNRVTGLSHAERYREKAHSFSV